jgi:hypothetical protein
MDHYAVLADRYATSTLPDLAHSALPHAPQQPYVERQRLIRSLVAAISRRRAQGTARHRESTAPVRPASTLRGVSSGG